MRYDDDKLEDKRSLVVVWQGKLLIWYCDELYLRSISTCSGFPLSVWLATSSMPSCPLSPAPNAYSFPDSVSAKVWAFQYMELVRLICTTRSFTCFSDVTSSGANTFACLFPCKIHNTLQCKRVNLTDIGSSKQVVVNVTKSIDILGKHQIYFRMVKSFYSYQMMCCNLVTFQNKCIRFLESFTMFTN